MPTSICQSALGSSFGTAFLRLDRAVTMLMLASCAPLGVVLCLILPIALPSIACGRRRAVHLAPDLTPCCSGCLFVFVMQIGYVQGMMTIGGLCLMYVTEEEAFWMLERLLRKRVSSRASAGPSCHPGCEWPPACVCLRICALGCAGCVRRAVSRHPPHSNVTLRAAASFLTCFDI